MHTELAVLFKTLLLSQPEVSRISAGRRSTLFAQGQKADALYFLEEGLIKLTRTNLNGGRLILSLYGPNGLLGEETFLGGQGEYQAEAEMLTTCISYRIPWTTIQRVLVARPEFGDALLRHVLADKLSLARKVELLCSEDVGSRIVYYLNELATLVQPSESDRGHSLPITQVELADLVGATRETISAALKHLERQGHVRLSRRLLTIFPGDAPALVAMGAAH